MKRPVLNGFLALALCIFAAAGAAAGQAPALLAGLRTVPLKFGINHITLPGGPAKVTAVLAWRSNFNAHGAKLLSFYFDESYLDSHHFDVIGFDGAGRAPVQDHELTTENGADCTLRDYLLLTGAGKSIILVAQRAFGSSYVDFQKVTFYFYALRKNPDMVPGRPLYYFRLIKTMTAKAKYCDVNQAIEDELGIDRGVPRSGPVA